ncbi:uncharacterized protein L3040_004328 [Drepanopeziza brunnea f. sp. 'multigermtubi']|uniref:uncharacterized protein n=1 Tax=Drepanopeziza brunnea f. sp. 'multigermtubi' TaxID=698441 RepID=UPI0023926316|nr:hypothetical protein L3040_004328 [Drepanopeziza brunnea f. sp. 'multigermtubi']
MTAPRTTSQDIRLGSAAQDAALRGASLAFGKPPVKPKPKINTYSGKNGALAAANSVEGGARQSQGQNQNSRNVRASGLEDPRGPGGDQRLAYQNTGSSIGSRTNVGGLDRNVTPQRPAGGRGYLQPPGALSDQSRSASFIAATIAASRSASTSPNTTGQQEIYAAKLRRPQGSRSPSIRSMNSSRSSEYALDTTPIPPTTSLIGMFEKNEASTRSVKRFPAERAAKATPTKVVRPAESESHLSRPARTPSPLANLERSPPVKENKPTLGPKSASEKSEARKPPTGQKPSLPPTKPIPVPRKTRPPVLELDPDNDASSDDSFVSASDYQTESTSPYQLSFRAELAARKSRPQHSNISATSSVTAVDSLANAIVASSLASSRAASPAKSLNSSSNTLYPAPPPPRRSGRTHLFYHSKDDPTRTPSPAKPQGPVLKTTLRKKKSKAEIDEREKRQGKKSFVKKHPNKHNEGDRKRWRDAITERERKRYEAVWASNKGLFANGEPGSEGRVVNVVVRDLWSRSRLHPDVLEEVWELVDRGKSGGLEKEEFVVGLWLVDQRLKGRKLPIRVSESVWKSVGVLSGIKVRKAYK